MKSKIVGKNHMAVNSISMFFALLGAIGAAVTAIYHGMKVMIKGILSVAGVFKGVKRAHQRIDAVELEIKNRFDVLTPMVMEIHQNLIGNKVEKD